MFGTLRTIISILREKDPPPAEKENITISLDDLCEIWIPYNNSFQPIPAIKENAAEAPPAGANLEVNQAVPADSVPSTTLPGLLPQMVSGAEAGKKMIAFNKFYEEVIEPYRDSFASQGLLDAVNRVVDILEKQGDCPSIIIEVFDTEADDIAPIRDALLKITVKEHTYRVTRNALNIMKKVYHDGSGMAPAMIIASLCHDIGKIRDLRPVNGTFAKADHPKISVQFIDTTFAGELSPYLLDLIKTAVRDHHMPSKDQFTVILKQADIEARATEVAEQSPAKTLDWAKWFDASEFLARLDPRVNVIQTGSYLKAFSLGETVYCEPALMHELTSNMAMSKGIIDLTLSRESERDAAIKKIVDSLREAGCISPDLGRGFVTRKYRVQFGTRKGDMYFVPLNLASFPDYQKIENRKKTYPPVMTGIRPV